MSGRALVRERRWQIIAAEGPQKVIAEKYGVTQGHVSKLRNGKILFRATKADTINARLVTLAFTPEAA